jgi:hypothetical protein
MIGTKSADYIQKAGFKKLEESHQEFVTYANRPVLVVK